MKRITLLLAVVAVAGAPSGCGRREPSFKDNSRDPMAYAQDVKMLVLTAARSARRTQEPLDYLNPVLLELKRTDRPLGGFANVYEGLRSRVERLVQDCERAGGRAANVAERLDEISKLAQTLPGDGLPASLK